MRKLFTILGAFLVLLALAGCTSGGDVVVTAPSFVGISIDETNPFDGTNYEQYYKSKDEPVLVEVVLDNPDNLDIRAIYINQYSYRSNTFLKGVDLLPENTNDNGVPCVANGREAEFRSTDQKIYFCMSAGKTLDLTEYTVDSIEYFDGSDTKDVIVQSNNEFHLYVYKSVPSVERENYSITQDSISVGFDVTDDDNVIIPNTLIAKVFLGPEEITELQQPLTKGLNLLTFDTEIMSDTNYEIKIFANYDIDDTTGVHHDEVLFSGNFTTLPTLIPSADIDNIVVASNEVSFDVTYDDVDEVTVPGGSRVAIFDGEIEVASMGLNGSVTGVTFDELLNSKQYSIKIISDYDLRDGSGTRTEYVLTQEEFETTARTVPEPQIDRIRVEENRIIFDILLEDDPTDPIIDISTLYADIYVDGIKQDTVFISGSHVELQINDVLSGKDIVIEFLATYDLNDGNGPQPNQVIGTLTRTSLLNSPPTVDVRDIEVTQGYINLDLSVQDVSNTLLGSVRAVLYRVEIIDDEEVEILIDTQLLSLEETIATFAHLVQADSNYRVKMIADYNLLDGEGEKENQVLYVQEITSLQPKAPAAEIHDPIITNDGLEFDVVVMDADNTVLPNSLFIYIYKDGIRQDALTQPLVVGLNHITYTDLNSNYVYEFRIEADYDVLDGSGLQENKSLLNQTLETLEKELPTSSIGAIDSTTESITFDVSVVDIDNVVIPGSIYAMLYYNNTPTGLIQPLVVGENTAISFAGIRSNTPYSIRIVSDYDLNDGVGVISEYSMTEIEFRTVKKLEPQAVIENLVATTDTITFDVTLSDVDAVLTSQARAVLYIDETFTGQSIDLSVGINSDIEFTGVFSDQTYIIYIEADYDLNDNINIITNDKIEYAFLETEPNLMVTGEFYDINVAIESITFSANIVDVSGVVTDELRAYLIEDDVPTGDFIELSVGQNIGLSFTNLNTDSSYTVQLSTNYDLGDVDGEQNVVLDSFSTATSAYTAPTAFISDINVTFDSVIFDVTVTDISNTSTGDYKAILYYQDAPQGQEVILSEGINQLQTFGGLLSGVQYEIKIEAIYDLRDGNGTIQEFVEMETFTTTAKLAPVGSADDIAITENQIYFKFNYVDIDNTLVPGSFIAWLYDENLQPIDSVEVSNSEIYFDLSYMPSNQKITIRVTGDYDLSDGSPVNDGVILNLELTTYVNQVPSVIISNTKINQEDVTFQLNMTDSDFVLVGDLLVEIYDSLGSLVGTVSVPVDYDPELGNYYDGSVTVPNVTLAEGVLHNLRVIADYNLRDTNGVQSNVVIGEKEIIAVNKIIPQAVIYNEVVDTNSIQVDIMIYNNHTAFVANATAAIFLDGVQIGVDQILAIGANPGITFAVPYSDADYEVIVTLDYDNGDGNGVVTNYLVASETLHTVAKVAPVASGVLDTATVDQATLDITVTDDDTVITGLITAELYRDGVPQGQSQVLSVGLNEDVPFTALLSDNSYEVRIFADYDLGDGVTVMTGEMIGIITFATEAKEVPTGEISDVVTDKNSITFDLNVTDTDAVIQGDIEVRLFKNNVFTGETVTTSSLIDTLTFSNVDSDSDFRLDVVIDYDLTNGLPVNNNVVIANAFATTFPNELATATIGGVVTDHNSAIFNVQVTDVDNIITGNLRAILVLGGVPTGDSVPLSVGNNVGLSFTNLLSIRTYQIVVVADVDLKDGSPVIADTQLDAQPAVTSETLVPLATISNIDLTNEEIEFDVNVLDDTETIVSDLRADLYKDDVYDNQSIPLSVGDNLDLVFTDLDYGVEYEIRILGTFNDNYDSADIPDYLIYYEYVTTIPLIEITDILLETNAMLFDVTVDDQFGIMADQLLRLELFEEDGTPLTPQYTVGTSTVQFENYFNDEVYRVDIYANITGEGMVLVSVQELAVPALQIQDIIWSDIAVDTTLNEVTVDITLELPDPNGVITTDPVTAVLYSITNGVLSGPLDTVTLLTGENNITFTPGTVTAGTTYMVVIEGTVNFNDGIGDQTGYAIDTRTFVPVQ